MFKPHTAALQMQEHYLGLRIRTKYTPDMALNVGLFGQSQHQYININYLGMQKAITQRKFTHGHSGYPIQNRRDDEKGWKPKPLFDMSYFAYTNTFNTGGCGFQYAW